jgi:hypothetical protein
MYELDAPSHVTWRVNVVTSDNERQCHLLHVDLTEMETWSYMACPSISKERLERNDSGDIVWYSRVIINRKSI